MAQYSGNLITNPQQSQLAQNYRRVRVGDSQLGTRQLQMYEIHIYGLSDAVASNVYTGSRDIVLDNTDDMDQPTIKELAGGSIVEAILRGVQEIAEIYMVGRVDYYHYDTDDNELKITVVVGADTVESNWEQHLNHENNGRQNTNLNSTSFDEVVGNSVEQWLADHEENWDLLDIYPAYLTGNSTETYGEYALAKLDPANVAVKDAQQARSVAMKAARVAAGKVSYTPKMKR